MTSPDTIKNQATTPCLCEFSSHPFDDCYCCHVTGRSASMIATYCMDRYQECPIYQKHVLKNEKLKDDVK
jgi:hypothetical protein